jgi:hypothetical protein
MINNHQQAAMKWGRSQVGATDKWQQQENNTCRIRMINNHQQAVMKGEGDRWGRYLSKNK